jgi:formamidase
MDLVVFPEYALHGLSMDTNPAIMCRMDGPEVAALQGRRAAIIPIWGCFSIMEFNPGRQSLEHRPRHRRHWRGAALLPQAAPVGAGRTVGAGRSGHPGHRRAERLQAALIICHDGMFPEMAREAAYKGAEIMLRTAGYTAPIRDAWRFTNQSNSFCNLMVTANVCMCGSDGTFDSMGEAMIVNFDGTVLAHGTTGRADEIITAEVRPDLVREARAGWGVENNIYQLGHRGFTAVKGGAQDCPYTYMHDLVAGRYRLPWEDSGAGDRWHVLRLSRTHPQFGETEGGRRMTTSPQTPMPGPGTATCAPTTRR